MDPAAFVLSNTALLSPPHVPELRLHLAPGRPVGAVQVDVGADGTAFTFAVGASVTPNNQLCTYRWWPALLR